MQKAAFLLLLCAAGSPRTACAQELPAAPKVPTRIAFESELAGRKALWDARDAAHRASGYSYLCRWDQARTDNQGRVSHLRGTETLYSAPGNKIALSFEYGDPGRRTVRRALCDGETFLALRFDERGKQATREYSQFSLEAVGRLDRAVAAARLDNLGQTRAADLVLNGDFTLLGRIWQGERGIVYEAESLTPRPGRPIRLHRYTIDTATQNLRRFEEWETREGRTIYRREDYSAAPKAAEPFSQAMPANYVERPVRLPNPTASLPEPESVDPRARALMAAWSRAYERFYTVHGIAQVSTSVQVRSADAPDPRRFGGNAYNGNYDLWLWRPGRALVEIEGSDHSLLPLTQTIRANGTEITVKAPGGTNRSLPLRELERIERQTQQVALRNSLDPLQWFVTGPPPLSDFQTVKYLGTVPLAGVGTTELVELARVDEDRQRNDRPVKTETRWRVWLGPDGLPRGFETVRKTTVEGMFERDQPPINTLAVRFTGFERDREPPFSG